MKKKSVAIVGFAQDTMSLVAYSQADEIWSINYAWKYNLPRIDRLFEIHRLEWLEIPDGKRSKEHVEWLRQEHPFPIYAFMEYEEIPASVAYPYDDVFSKINWPWRMEVFEDGVDARGNPIYKTVASQEEYLQSTIVYMVLLALHEGFDQVELYGVSMKSDTEYGYQRPNLEWTLGYLGGKGVDVIVPNESTVLNGRVYHLDGQALKEDDVERHAVFYRKQMIKNRQLVEYHTQKADGQPSHEALNAQRMMLIYSGALTMCMLVQDKIGHEGIIGRQNLESAAGQYNAQRDAEMALANHWNGVLSERERTLLRRIFNRKSIEAAKSEASMHQQKVFMFYGRHQALIKMMDNIESEIVSLELVNELEAHQPGKES